MSKASNARMLYDIQTLSDAKPGATFRGSDGLDHTVTDAVVVGSLGGIELIGSWRIPATPEENEQFVDGVPVEPEDEAADWRAYVGTMTVNETLGGVAPSQFEVRIGVNGPLPASKAIEELSAMGNLVAYVDAPEPGGPFPQWTFAGESDLVMQVDAQGGLRYGWASEEKAQNWSREAPNLDALRRLLAAG
jgi:hypothetical protein